MRNSYTRHGYPLKIAVSFKILIAWKIFGVGVFGICSLIVPYEPTSIIDVPEAVGIFPG